MSLGLPLLGIRRTVASAHLATVRSASGFNSYCPRWPSSSIRTSNLKTRILSTPIRAFSHSLSATNPVTNQPKTKPNMAPKPSIVLVHGLWMTPHSWEDWIARFEKSGYTVLAPGWPGVGTRSVADICADPSALNGVTIANVVDHYEDVIKKLDTPPIIMGHSFGGLFVQLLLSRGLGSAGIAVSAAGPAGVNVLTLTVVKSIFPVLKNPFNYNGLVPLSHEQFHYVFTNELELKDSEKVYNDYYIPGSAHVLWQGALAGLHNSGDGEVIWDKADRAPLLLIGGSNDHIVPTEVPKTVLKKYTGPALVEYKEFSGRTHHIVGQTGWEEVADYSLQWAEKHLK